MDGLSPWTDSTLTPTSLITMNGYITDVNAGVLCIYPPVHLREMDPSSVALLQVSPLFLKFSSLFLRQP